MVGHQHVSMNAATGLAGVLSQPVEIETIILVGDKAGLAVITTLNQVQRSVWQRKAGRRGMARGEVEWLSAHYKPWSVPYYSYSLRPLIDGQPGNSVEIPGAGVFVSAVSAGGNLPIYSDTLSATNDPPYVFNLIY